MSEGRGAAANAVPRKRVMRWRRDLIGLETARGGGRIDSRRCGYGAMDITSLTSSVRGNICKSFLILALSDDKKSGELRLQCLYADSGGQASRRRSLTRKQLGWPPFADSRGTSSRSAATCDKSLIFEGHCTGDVKDELHPKLAGKVRPAEKRGVCVE